MELRLGAGWRPSFGLGLIRVAVARDFADKEYCPGGALKDRTAGGSVDRYLNVFLPYERPPHHEDQLTRAAMIMMRALPLARDAFLARVGALPSARLPEPELDMQTRHVMKSPALMLSGAEGPSLHQLISVFLSPDEGLDLSTAKIQERVREQRLDGVLRFGDGLVVVIESKTVGHASSDQAKQVRLREVKVQEQKVIPLGWHELLEDWWTLLERELLAPAERVLMEDLIAFVEEHFAHLLPFTTLGRAGEHGLRRQRRLMALLREATGLTDVEPERPGIGATVMLDAAIRTKSTQRMALQQRAESLVLCTWPAELKPQAETLYRTGRAWRLMSFLAAHADAWQARPNMQLAFRNAPVTQRLFPHCHLNITEYVHRWSGDDFNRVGAHRYDHIREDLWPWLQERQYADSEDDQQLDAFLKRLGRRDAHLRPGIEVQRIWPWAHAVDLDERGALASEVRTAVAELLAALDEPSLPACADKP